MNNSTLAALSQLAISLLNVKRELANDSDVLALWETEVGVELDELPDMASEIMHLVQEADGMRHEDGPVLEYGDRVRVRTWDEMLTLDGVDVTLSKNALSIGKRYFSRAMGRFGNKVLSVSAVACDADGVYYRLSSSDGIDVGFCFDAEMLEKID